MTDSDTTSKTTAEIFSFEPRKIGGNSDHSPANKGLARALLGGEGYSLIEAFRRLKLGKDTEFSLRNPRKNWFGDRLEVGEAEGVGHWDFCQFGHDFYVVITDVEYAEPRSEYLPGDGLIEFHIKLSGHLTIMTSRSDPVEVDGPSLLVWAQPEGVNSNELAESEKEMSVTIYFKPSYVFKNLITANEQIPVHLARFILNRKDSINYCQLPITSEILNAASLVIQSSKRFKGLLLLNYVHAKSEELICNIVAAFDQLASKKNESYTENEIQQLREAKKIVAEEFDPPPTIKQIARTVGTNDSKLKCGFKALFGETIYQYRNRHRMKKAIQLIEEGMPIWQVSEQVGYQHQASFTNAFKSYYKNSPKDCRKMSR